jgi:hypothetical protein
MMIFSFFPFGENYINKFFSKLYMELILFFEKIRLNYRKLIRGKIKKKQKLRILFYFFG